MTQEPRAVEGSLDAVERERYRGSRLAFLSSLVDVASDVGLEIGALDFPIVLPGAGRCAIADRQGADDLARRFGIPREAICDVTYVVSSDRTLADQIAQRFGYVVLCHVLEHVPDPIRFLNDIAELLEPGGVLFAAIPDKRRTADAGRPSTTLDELVKRYEERATSPPVAQVVEFAVAWVDELAQLAAESPDALREWARRNVESGQADVHCNVWRDRELFAQLDALIERGLLPGLEFCAGDPNRRGFNEFYVALRKVAPSTSMEVHAKNGRSLRRFVSAFRRRTIEREDYRQRRLALLRGLVDLRITRGLEIGALDLPTVAVDQGRCAFADFRSHEELVRLFALPEQTVVRTTYIIDSERTMAEQVPQQFDYVIFCHVLEHAPDPIGFLRQLAEILEPGGVLFFAVPDKRRTRDSSRPSTTLDQLLERYYLRSKVPSLAQVMEYSRAWSDELRELSLDRPRVFYEFAVNRLESGMADAHCSVWRDEELFGQLETLIEAGFLPDLKLVAREANVLPFNEFYVVLRKRPDRPA